MRRTLIRGAYVLTMDADIGSLPEGDVLIDGHLIAAVGRGLPADGAEIIDGTNRIALPGFVDTHRHMYSSMLRGCGGWSDYETFWRTVSQGYGSHFTAEDTYVSARLGLAEAIDSGITTLHAWEQNIETPAHADAALRALIESGLRGRFSYGPASNPSSGRSHLNGTQTIDLEDVLRLREEVFRARQGKLAMTPDDRVHLGIACRSVKATAPAIWQREFAFARAEGLPITTHVFAPGDIGVYREYQALGRDVLAVHASHSTDEDIRYLAESRTPVSVADTALLRCGIGRSPIVELMRTGVLVCLSVDTTAAGDTGDMFSVMRTSLGVERAIYQDATVYTPDQVLRQATINGAIALGLGDVTGSLTPGKRADVILVRTDDLNIAPLNVPETQVVLCGQPRNVDVVYIDGVCRKHSGKLVGLDVPALVRAAQEAVAGLGKRIGRSVT